jgi:hypothetical protein
MTMGVFSGCSPQHNEPEFTVSLYWEEAGEHPPGRAVVGVSNRLREITPGHLFSPFEKIGDKRTINGQDYYGVVVFPEVPPEGQGERQLVIEAFVRNKPGPLRIMDLYVTSAVPFSLNYEHVPGAIARDATSEKTYGENHEFVPGTYHLDVVLP